MNNKRYTSVDVGKIKNGWLVETHWERGDGDDTEYDSEKVFCANIGEALDIVKEILPSLEE